MLKREVVEAAEQGKFHIHAVDNVDQAISILTGMPYGEPDKKGIVPPGTINHLVATQLAELSHIRQELSGVPRRHSTKAKEGKAAKEEKDTKPT